MRRTLALRCAGATSGQVAAAAPARPMNSRRLMATPRRKAVEFCVSSLFAWLCGDFYRAVAVVHHHGRMEIVNLRRSAVFALHKFLPLGGVEPICIGT